ncbi:MAG: DUF4215 domain-containing protein, partial [Myxococcales bacterium]|nr:DUF4215 domain-containing protein [Myxococcales bacterium]
ETINGAAGESCDDAGESSSCDGDCTLATCGDLTVNHSAGEQCDDGNNFDDDGCVRCKLAVCGDGSVQTPFEECDDGNTIDDDLCTNACLLNTPPCEGGGIELAVAPSGQMKVCDDPDDVVCEQDQETLCPLGWHLCSLREFNNRNNGWSYPVSPEDVVVGEIYCRGGGGAGHLTLGPYDGLSDLGDDALLNCGFGSSRAACPGALGCNEPFVQALCCAPAPLCGDGVVNSVEEECDDGDLDETDECLNSCAWRQPTAHGLSGIGC